MEVQASDFYYNGTSLSSLGDFALVSFDTSASNSDVTMMSMDINRSSLTYNSPISHYYNKVASDVLKWSITIIHKENVYLSQSDVRTLTGWLMSPVKPCVAYFVPCSDRSNMVAYRDIDYIGVFNSWSYTEIAQNQKIGITFYFENISPYAFTKEQTYTCTANTNNNGTVTIDSVHYTGQEILPTITLETSNYATVTLNNDSDYSREALSINANPSKTIVISNYNLFDSNNNLLDFDDYLNNFNWVKLIDGQNVLTMTVRSEQSGTVSATATITVRFLTNVGV